MVLHTKGSWLYNTNQQSYTNNISSTSAPIAYPRFGFPPQLPIRVGRFFTNNLSLIFWFSSLILHWIGRVFTNELIYQFFLSVPPPPGASRSSAPTIFRFPPPVTTGLGGFPFPAPSNNPPLQNLFTIAISARAALQIILRIWRRIAL